MSTSENTNGGVSVNPIHGGVGENTPEKRASRIGGEVTDPSKMRLLEKENSSLVTENETLKAQLDDYTRILREAGLQIRGGVLEKRPVFVSVGTSGALRSSIVGGNRFIKREIVGKEEVPITQVPTLVRQGKPVLRTKAGVAQVIPITRISAQKETPREEVLRIETTIPKEGHVLVKEDAQEAVEQAAVETPIQPEQETIAQEEIVIPVIQEKQRTAEEILKGPDETLLDKKTTVSDMAKKIVGDDAANAALFYYEATGTLN